MLSGQPLDIEELTTTKTARIGNPHRINPDFGNVALMLDMNVRRFVAVCRIEEESDTLLSTVGNRLSPMYAFRPRPQAGRAALLTPVLITGGDGRRIGPSCLEQK